MRDGRFADVAKAYDKASAVATSGAREVYKEYARRACFYQEQGPLRGETQRAAQQEVGIYVRI